MIGWRSRHFLGEAQFERSFSACAIEGEGHRAGEKRHVHRFSSGSFETGKLRERSKFSLGTSEINFLLTLFELQPQQGGKS